MRYRMCKFCGLYQDIGGKLEHLQATAHCAEDPRGCVAGATYVQWARVHESTRQCDYCGADYIIRENAIARPKDAFAHPWWEVPQRQTPDEALEFWRSVGVEGRRLYL
jgi:hypothetical protein